MREKQVNINMAETSEPPMSSKAMQLSNKLREFKLHMDLIHNSKVKDQDLQKEVSLMKVILAQINSHTALILSENLGFN